MNRKNKNFIVIFYSRTGNTEFAAETIASYLKADLIPLKDKKKRNGLWGWFIAGRDALLEKTTELEDVDVNLDKYDLIFIGCPNWASNIPPAIRTFLNQKYWANKKVIFFCTQENMGAERVFNNLRRLTKEADVISEKYFNKVNINKNIVRKQIKDWLASLNLDI